MFSYWMSSLYFGNKNKFFTKSLPNTSSEGLLGRFLGSKHLLTFGVWKPRVWEKFPKPNKKHGFFVFCSKVLHDEKEASTCRKAQRKKYHQPPPPVTSRVKEPQGKPPIYLGHLLWVTVELHENHWVARGPHPCPRFTFWSPWTVWSSFDTVDGSEIPRPTTVWMVLNAWFITG